MHPTPSSVSFVAVFGFTIKVLLLATHEFGWRFHLFRGYPFVYLVHYNIYLSIIQNQMTFPPGGIFVILHLQGTLLEINV